MYKYINNFRTTQESKIINKIACRDHISVGIINKSLLLNNTDESVAFFFGCITLLLLPPLNLVKNNVILCLDVPVDKVRDILKNKGVNIEGKEFKSGTAIYKSTNNLLQQLKLARDQLMMYASSYKIFTSRLHCFLPCKAMGVDVTFMGNDKDTRMSDFVSATSEQLDEIISIGNKCPTAMILRDLKIYKESYPFDYIPTTPRLILKYMKDQNEFLLC